MLIYKYIIRLCTPTRNVSLYIDTLKYIKTGNTLCFYKVYTRMCACVRARENSPQLSKFGYIDPTLYKITKNRLRFHHTVQKPQIYQILYDLRLQRFTLEIILAIFGRTFFGNFCKNGV